MNDKIKEKINYLKLWLGLLVLTIVGSASWFINNYSTANKMILFGDFVFIIFLFIFIVIIHIKISKNINKL